ncbi:MAG TPA: GWxTD domain-containing protein [Candidatus Sulfotelmatobacter sp.]|nr:GWxTD domain-containing protein [Candidatus Sulfotelmatobacter sp.]
MRDGHRKFALDGAPPLYKVWLQEDVAWIITDEERETLKNLKSDEQRDNFMEAFWQRRDPIPDTEENEYKEEHYQRIAYANERFGAGIPGWKSDRGRIWIMFGEPDEIENDSAGDKLDQPKNATPVTPPPHPLEIWRYHYLEGIGQNVVLEFVDACDCGDYHLTLEPSEKEALVLGLNRLREPLHSMGGPDAPAGVAPRPPSARAVPRFKFPDLAVALQQMHVNPLPFDVLTDYVRVTEATTLVPSTLQFKNRELKFGPLTRTDGIDRAAVDILGRVSTLTGRVVETFEDTLHVDVPHELLARVAGDSATYSHGSLLPPGRYKLKIAAKDVNGERIGVWARNLVVPQFGGDTLAASSLIVGGMRQSHQAERPCITQIGGAHTIPPFPPCVFEIGGTHIIPIVPPADGKPVMFRRNQQINVWIQVYNLHIDEKKRAPSAAIEYSVVNTASNANVSHQTSSTDTMGPLADQLTLQKTISAATLQPGAYALQIKVHDNYSGQTISESTAFAVE